MMKNTFLVLCVTVVVLYLSGQAKAWLFGKSHSECQGGKPYYFGTTDLLCKIGRRSAPSRFALSVSHRWILFDGEYFEWGVQGHSYNYGSTLTDAERCSTERESQPAGYSQLDKTCIEKCARSYRGRYGPYHLLTNNCHDFANRISEVLCNHTICPQWCQ
ncbi:deubiquitinase DESI2-like [Ostrea edulis]|uniref:deubiquitinase DESI2-like n=1 Tax=Ostrea edulis TaxID=37623 RepID=UPI0024AF818B|nr:deubiquitinase DESI2-like [Ostrea edulis]